MSIKLLFNIKSIIVGIAVLNFATFLTKTIEVNSSPGIKFCFGQPWYVTNHWSYLPFLLLIGAIGLYLDKRFGILISIASCLVSVYLSCISILIEGGLTQWSIWMFNTPDFFFQFIFASLVLFYGIARLKRKTAEKQTQSR